MTITQLDIPGSSDLYRPIQEKIMPPVLSFDTLDERLKQRINESKWGQFAQDLRNVRRRTIPTILVFLTNDICASPCCNLCSSNYSGYEKHAKELGIRRQFYYFIQGILFVLLKADCLFVYNVILRLECH
jgi:hypothetical protein